MKRLVQPETLAWVKKALPAMREEIAKKYGFTSEHRFWARTLASVAVASTIVKDLRLVSFSPDRILEWALETLVSAKESEVGHTQEASHVIARFLASRINETLVMPHEWRPSERKVLPMKVPQRGLVVRHEFENGRISIDERALREFLSAEGVSWQSMIIELKEKKMLLNYRRMVTLGAGTEIVTGQIPCLEIDAKHPVMSGHLRVIEETVKEEKVR